jgi:sulfonate transport system substrate-binding protein
MLTTLARRWVRALAPVVALSLAAIPAARAETPGTVRIGFQRSSTLTALMKANGTLEKALEPLGVAVTWHEFTSGLPLAEAVNLGAIDVSADVADTVPVFAQAAGAKLVFVAEEAPSPSAQAILVPAGSPVKTVAELKGKTVAVTKGAGSHYLLLAALKEAGLTAKDIKPAYLTPADGRAAFVSGNVDAWVTWDPFLASTIAASGATVLRDGTGLSGYKRYYLTTEPFAKDGAKVLDVVFDELAKTGEWVKSHPDEAAQQLAALWSIDAAAVEQANARRSYKVGAVTREGLSEQQHIADTFRAEGLFPREVDAEDVGLFAPHAD